jgi:TIR domain
MHALDPRTVERIAKIIVDSGGDQERPGWQLERLLRHAGWADPPEYDGSPRVSWITEVLLERIDPATDAARLLCRACHPLEYDGGRPVAEWFREHLNKAIESEGLMITLVDGRPIVGEIDTGVSVTPVFSQAARRDAVEVDAQRPSGRSTALDPAVDDFGENSPPLQVGSPPVSSGPAPNGPLVFLCHSSGDKEHVRRLYRQLCRDGVCCWFDEEDLRPGQDWEREINRAIRASRYVLACLSAASISKAGFVQKELRKALDVADEQPEGSTFLIPVRLEECEIPDRLSKWQWVDLYRETGYQRLVRVLSQ